MLSYKYKTSNEDDVVQHLGPHRAISTGEFATTIEHYEIDTLGITENCGESITYGEIK